MKDRIKKTFKKLKENDKAALITFITAGDPNIDLSLKIIENLPKVGADIIEIGIPFSDPMADGPVIQKSYNRALEKGIKLSNILNIVEIFRKSNSFTPIVLMGYYNPIFKYGVDRFINEAKKKGIDGVLIVDLPTDADEKVENKFLNSNLDFIKLTTPTTSKSRLKNILIKTTGFLYYVSITGITGSKISSLNNMEKNYKKLKKFTKLPFVIGFGINTSEKVKKIAKFADGIVVGSAIVKEIENNLENDDKIYKSIINLTKKYSNIIKGTRLEKI